MIVENDIITAQSDLFFPDFYLPKAVAFDIETYADFGIYGGMEMHTGRIVGIIMRRGKPFDSERLHRIMKNYFLLGYNCMNFDIPLATMAVDGANTDSIKKAANVIIGSGVKWWDVEKTLNITIPKTYRYSDLMEVNPAIHQSLKTMNGRLMGREMEDLPIEHDQEVSEQEEKLIRYWFKDLKATALLANTLEKDLQLREELGKQINADLMSKSDSQMGFAIIKKRIEDLRGSRIKKPDIKTVVSFNYKAPDYINFTSPVLRELLRKIQDHQFVTKSDGKVDLPKWLSDEKITIGPSTFQMGIGGLHSTEANRAVKADAENAMVSVDVASMYPQLLLSLGLYPAAVGPDFLAVYEAIRDDRIKAKRAGDKVRDKGLKIALNGGGFGRLGSRFSLTFAPHMLIAVTLTGQLSLLMLIERAFNKGILTVSANTDGAEFLCPRSLFNGWIEKDGRTTDRLAPSAIAEVVEHWERDTGMVLEGVEYTALYNLSVNSYIAIKADGSHKRKGPLANPWCKEDFDPRGQMSKNPQAYVVSDAVLARIKRGTPVEETIRNCNDVRAFITVVNATGGAEWRGEYLGKVVRYYWSTDGDAIYKVKANASGTNPKVPKTDGCCPLMTLPDDFLVPDDLDYARYIQEAEQILTDIGFYGDKREPIKIPRATKENAWRMVSTYLVAA